MRKHAQPVNNYQQYWGWWLILLITFNQHWLNFSNIFRVMLKFNSLSKVAAELKSATPTKLRVFPPIAHSSACGSCNASVPVIDIAGPYRRTRRRLCAVSARSRLSTAGGSSPAARPQRSEALRGKSLQRGTAAPLSSPSSIRVCSLSARGSARRPGVCASSGREEEEEEEGRLKLVRWGKAKKLAFPSAGVCVAFFNRFLYTKHPTLRRFWPL